MRCFMFAFTGPWINREILKEKIQTVEVGVLENNVKYCVMRMFQPNGRREPCLLNIVSEYNTLCGEEITLVPCLGGFPLVMADKTYCGNPIDLKVKIDRVSNALGYEKWTNPAV